MRVISGRYGGRRLRAPDTNDTRPVTDRVKESVFSSLGTRLAGVRVADLYAGAGSFGIEALSRGAEEAVFVESGRKALVALRANLETLGIEAEVVDSTVERWLPAVVGRFEVVFCDPPWPLTSPELAAILTQVGERLESGGLVVVTRRASDPVPEPEGLAIDDERRFGDTRIIRYERER